MPSPAPALAPRSDSTWRLTTRRGLDLLRHPALNKGTAFSAEERSSFGLDGLLPAGVETLEQQVERCWQAFQALEDPLQCFHQVEAIRRSNLVLFHRFLADHLKAVLPIVYTPTVGAAIQGFSRSYRSPVEGIFLSANQRGRLRQVLRAAIWLPWTWCWSRIHKGCSASEIRASAASTSARENWRCTRSAPGSIRSGCWP